MSTSAYEPFMYELKAMQRQIITLTAELSRYKNGVEVEGIIEIDNFYGSTWVDEVNLPMHSDFKRGQRVRVLVIPMEEEK